MAYVYGIPKNICLGTYTGDKKWLCSIVIRAELQPRHSDPAGTGLVFKERGGGSFLDGGHSGMLDNPLHRDSVELFSDLMGAADH